MEDVSKKRGMDYRLLHSVAYGCTWYGRWGYFFGRGSFGNTLATWRNAVETLQVPTPSPLPALPIPRGTRNLSSCGLSELLSTSPFP